MMPMPDADPRSVLVIDDDPLMRELLTALLAAKAHNVAAASSGEEALHWLTSAAAKPDVILTDMRMPGMETAQLLKMLHESCAPGMLLLGMSASPATEEELQMLDGFLTKPFGTEEFQSAVDRAGSTHVSGPPTQAHDSVAAQSINEAVVLDHATYQRLAASLPQAQLRELYRLSMDDVRGRLATMRAAADAGDFDTCRREAHAIKGGCGMVGAAELRALAAAIEAGAPVDTPALDEIAAACDRLQRMLDALP